MPNFLHSPPGPLCFETGATSTYLCFVMLKLAESEACAWCGNWAGKLGSECYFPISPRLFARMGSLNWLAVTRWSKCVYKLLDILSCGRAHMEGCTCSLMWQMFCSIFILTLVVSLNSPDDFEHHASLFLNSVITLQLLTRLNSPDIQEIQHSDDIKFCLSIL